MQNKHQHLNSRQENIVRIAALTARGDLPRLSEALVTGLNNGLTVNEIKEVLVQMYAYSGFPRSLNGINTFIAVLEKRKAQGIEDNPGQGATPITDTRSKYERGQAVLVYLTGRQDVGQTSGFGAFSPEIDVFLKEHLFADIFGSDVLSFSERELATIAALASLNGVEPMLQAHMGMGMNIGISEPQLRELLSIIKTSIGKQEAKTGLEVLGKVLVSKDQRRVDE